MSFPLNEKWFWSFLIPVHSLQYNDEEYDEQSICRRWVLMLYLFYDFHFAFDNCLVVSLNLSVKPLKNKEWN
jgi:hypothetical protein